MSKRGKLPAPRADTDISRSNRLLEEIVQGNWKPVLELIQTDDPLAGQLRQAMVERLLENTKKASRGRPALALFEKRMAAAQCVFATEIFSTLRTTLSQQDALLELASIFKVSESRIKRILYPEAKIADIAREMDLRDAVIYWPPLRHLIHDHLELFLGNLPEEAPKPIKR